MCVSCCGEYRGLNIRRIFGPGFPHSIMASKSSARGDVACGRILRNLHKVCWEVIKDVLGDLKVGGRKLN